MTEPSKNEDQSAEKAGSGRFQPGNTLGRGRTAGSRNKATLLLDEIADGQAEEILKSVLQAARDGKSWAADLILTRVWPARKTRAVVLDLPEIKSAGDVLEAQSAIVRAAVGGEVALDEAEALAGLIDRQRRAVETVALEQRLAALEEALRKK